MVHVRVCTATSYTIKPLWLFLWPCYFFQRVNSFSITFKQRWSLFLHSFCFVHGLIIICGCCWIGLHPGIFFICNATESFKIIDSLQISIWRLHLLWSHAVLRTIQSNYWQSLIFIEVDNKTKLFSTKLRINCRFLVLLWLVIEIVDFKECHLFQKV